MKFTERILVRAPYPDDDEVGFGDYDNKKID